MEDFCDDADYLYAYVYRKSPAGWLPVRIAKSDGSLTEITVSGTAPPSGNCNVKTDGTYFYVHQVFSNSISKYSFSGTTWTYVSAITLEDYATRFATDGTSIWYVTYDSLSTRDNTLYRAGMTGTTVSYRMLTESVFGEMRGLDVDRGYLWGNAFERLRPEFETNQYPWIIPIEKT